LEYLRKGYLFGLGVGGVVRQHFDDWSKKLSVVLVTTPLGGGHFNDKMKGKLQMPMEQSNCFSTAKAKPRTFSAFFPSDCFDQRNEERTKKVLCF
jgi:hypothetical protein